MWKHADAVVSLFYLCVHINIYNTIHLYLKIYLRSPVHACVENIYIFKNEPTRTVNSLYTHLNRLGSIQGL